ncbi:Uncharacterised protein [Prevotella melaninogenica]|nr:Uncharacterised protein [Prevotella melaninogenica]
MKLLAIISLSLMLGNVFTESVSDNSKNSVVYICTGPKAETFHKHKDCSGLNKCSGTIKALSISKAKEMGRRACKICY